MNLPACLSTFRDANLHFPSSTGHVVSGLSGRWLAWLAIQRLQVRFSSGSLGVLHVFYDFRATHGNFKLKTRWHKEGFIRIRFSLTLLFQGHMGLLTRGTTLTTPRGLDHVGWLVSVLDPLFQKPNHFFLVPLRSNVNNTPKLRYPHGALQVGVLHIK